MTLSIICSIATNTPKTFTSSLLSNTKSNSTSTWTRPTWQKCNFSHLSNNSPALLKTMSKLQPTWNQQNYALLPGNSMSVLTAMNMLRSRAILPIGKRNFSANPENLTPKCNCAIVSKKVDALIKSGNREELKKHVLGNCQIAKNFKTEWRSYSPETDQTAVCEAAFVFRGTLPIQVLKQSNVKHIDKKAFGIDMSALVMEKDVVNLAGEGGAITKTQTYWQPVFDAFKNDSKVPFNIVSVGGGVGNDARASAEIFKKNEFKVDACHIVDPNVLAAWLAHDQDGTYFVTMAQQYFSQFKRNEESRYVFHLGTLLNVVSEDSAVQILQDLAKNMKENDVLSILIVDKGQFEVVAKRNEVKRVDNNNIAGLVKYVHTNSNARYKTAIGDEQKFIQFCEGMGLKKIAFETETVNCEKVGKATFIASKAIKTDKY